MSDVVTIEIIKTIGIILTPLLLVLLNSKLNRMHKQFNSRMDESLKVTKELGRAEGKVQGIASEKKENAKKKKP